MSGFRTVRTLKICWTSGPDMMSGWALLWTNQIGMLNFSPHIQYFLEIYLWLCGKWIQLGLGFDKGLGKPDLMVNVCRFYIFVSNSEGWDNTLVCKKKKKLVFLFIYKGSRMSNWKKSNWDLEINLQEKTKKI